MKRFLTVVGVLIAVCASGDPGTNQPAKVHTKTPWGVGFGMKGTVTNVAEVGEKIHFRFTGWFYVRQYPWGGTNEEVINVDCRQGVSAIVTKTDSFVATVPNLNAAAVKPKADLLPIFKAAAERGRELTIRLLSPKLDFGGQPFIQDAQIWRITDWDLR